MWDGELQPHRAGLELVGAATPSSTMVGARAMCQRIHFPELMEG
jgi:hypothetical protein